MSMAQDELRQVLRETLKENEELKAINDCIKTDILLLKSKVLELEGNSFSYNDKYRLKTELCELNRDITDMKQNIKQLEMYRNVTLTAATNWQTNTGMSDVTVKSDGIKYFEEVGGQHPVWINTSELNIK